MGRKSQAKQNSRKINKQTKQKHQTGTENNKYVLQKRKELLVLVDKLFRLTSTFQNSPKITKTWDHHLEIDKIIKQINNIECSFIKQSTRNPRQSNIANFIKWMKDNEAHFDGIEIAEFEGYDLGLKATENFIEDSLILTVPRKVMISEKNARDSELADFIAVDPMLQNMPNIMLALFLLLEKNKTDSFWKPYIDILPEIYTTVLYFTEDELSDLRPSPVFESSLKLYRSIARQYAYFYIKIHTLDIPALQNLRSVFTYDNYRWAVSTVMTRQNNLRLSDTDTTAFIPLWDMCNHEHGKMTTDFNKELNRAECYALRNFQAGEQIFIFYGARPNADLFLHNGFVYPNNQHDSVSLGLGISTGDPLRPAKLALLAKLGLAGVTHYHVYRGDHPVSAELLAFIRIFNMNEEELQRWSSISLPGELVAGGAGGAAAAGAALERRAHRYLATRCRLVRDAYAHNADGAPDSAHRRNIKLLKECKVQILDGAIKYLENVLQKLPTVDE